MSDNTNPYNRPMAKFTDGGRLEVRASALGRCRRALWYSATDQPVTNPTSPESLTIMESGNALEPVVIRAMQRAGWTIQPVDRDAPTSVTVELGDHLVVSGHPDATGFLPADGANTIDRFLFDDSPPTKSDELVIEVKTRGPEAFKRWRTLGAERSHPDSVAQAACYSLGLFGECRDIVIATLDTGSRSWDHEVIPAERVERAWNRACGWLGSLADHLDANGPDSDILPERDFEATDWHCRSCPYLNGCQPELPASERVAESVNEPFDPVSDEDAQLALWRYEELSELIKSLNADKRESLATLEGWFKTQGVGKSQLDVPSSQHALGKEHHRWHAPSTTSTCWAESEPTPSCAAPRTARRRPAATGHRPLQQVERRSVGDRLAHGRLLGQDGRGGGALRREGRPGPRQRSAAAAQLADRFRRASEQGRSPRQRGHLPRLAQRPLGPR